MKSTDLMGIRCDNFEVRVEYNEHFVIWHLPHIEKMTKGVFLEMADLLNNWLKFYKTVGYDAIHAGTAPDHPINKLLHMLGFEYIGEHEGFNIYRLEGGE